MSTLVDPELKGLVLAEFVAEGAPEALVSTVRDMLEDGRLVPVRLPDGSLGVKLNAGTEAALSLGLLGSIRGERP